MSLLEETAISLFKKREILKDSILQSLEYVIGATDNLSEDERIALLQIIHRVSEGKIFLEGPFAKSTKLLADIFEAQGKVDKAAEIFCDFQIETFGSLPKKTKVEYIINQIRLSLLTKQPQKAKILSRKLTLKTFESPDIKDLKVQYLEQLIQISINEANYLDCCSYYSQIFEAREGDDLGGKVLQSLKLAIIFAILSPKSPSRQQILQKLHSQALPLPGLNIYLDVLKQFMAQEMITWAEFSASTGGDIISLISSFPNSEAHLEQLKKRVAEHNIYVVSLNYQSISLMRFTELVDHDRNEAERILELLISSGKIVAKIDNINSIIHFGVQKSVETILNTWDMRINELLTSLVSINHKVLKEDTVKSNKMIL